MKTIAIKLLIYGFTIIAMILFGNHFFQENETKIEVKDNTKFIDTGSAIELPKKDKYLVYQGGTTFTDEEDPTGKLCKVKWSYTRNINEADAVIYNSLDSYGQISSIRSYSANKNQFYVVESMESMSNYPMCEENKRYFNFSMDYRLTSDFPIPYSLDVYNFEIKPLPFEKKTGLVAAFISNCGAANGRTEYVKELMEYIDVDSYGSCLNNIRESGRSDPQVNKMEIIRRYKFTLAFENSDDDDYVTEKLYQPLEVGSVPIFRGHDHIEDFSPTNGVIDANKFGSAKELAEFLNKLSKDKSEYEKYLEWKKGDWGEAFKRVLWIRRKPHYGVCALLERLRHKWINPYLTVWHRKSKHPDACITCLRGYKGEIADVDPGEEYVYPGLIKHSINQYSS